MRPFSGVAQTSVCALCRGANRPPISDSRRQIQAGRNYRAELRSSSPASFHRRCNSPPRHPGILSRRESAAQAYVRCSTTELQRLSSLAGIEPATVGSRCNPSLHHAANSFVFFLLTSSLPHFSSAHTRSASRRGSLLSAKLALQKIPGGIGAHGISGFEPEPCGFAR
jgi:hypothetical protein